MLKSVLDLLLAGRAWRDKIIWQTVEPIRNSYHLPIDLNVTATVTALVTSTKAFKWKRGGVE